MTQQDFLNENTPIAAALLAYAKNAGATDADIRISASDVQKNTVEEGEVADISSGRSVAVAVTLYSGLRKLSFTKNSLDLPAIHKAIDDNMRIIHLVPENPYTTLLEPEKIFHGESEDFDIFDTTQVSQEDLINYAKTVDKTARAYPGIKSIRTTQLTKSFNHSLIMASNGLQRVNSFSAFGASVSAIAEDANGMQINYDGVGASHFAKLPDPQAMAFEAASGAVAKLSPALPAKGTMPVILSHDAAETFFGSVIEAMDGSEIYNQTSFFKDQIGKKVMHESVTLADNPRLKGSTDSIYMDSTGIECKPMTFIENGILKSYHMNLEEARKLGMEPIGRHNGMRNVSVLPGQHSVEELMADIEEGIYIKDFKGGSADVNNGTFSREAYGVMIRKGAVTQEAVDGFVVVGNLKEMFANVALANNTPVQPNLRHTICAPMLRLNGMQISAAE